MLDFIYWFVFLVAIALAWGIGGEPGFGKWKRGALLAIPMTLVGVGTLSIVCLILQIVFLLGLYQALFYGKAISLVYDKGNKWGWGLIIINGALIGLTPLFFIQNALGLYPMIGYSSLLFSLLVFLANDPSTKTLRDKITSILPDWYLYIDKNGNKIGQLKDFWFDCSCIMGLFLGLLVYLLI